MPVLVNPKACVDRDNCFAAGACPYGAFLHNSLKRTWEVDATICGDCPGPCLNFCDKDALLWGDDLVDLSLVKAQLEGRMKPDEVLEARLKHKKEVQAALEAAKKKSNEDVLDLTRANFEQEVLRSDIPVVVDCWADWCAPCKQFSPVFEATAKQYVGVVKFAKLDTDAEPGLARGLGINALPTVLMFFKGQLVNVAEGALPASQFQGWLYQTLAAVRQYQAQLEAEAGDAITAASQNLSSLDGEEYEEEVAGQASADTGQGVILDSKSSAPPPVARADTTLPGAPGKRTASGLYIP
jgi:thioredoxin 2